mgnify:CR=1 FL=1
METGVSAGSGTTGTTQSTGRSSVRGARENVANDAGVSGRGNESSRRAGASGTTTLSVDQPTRLESPAAVANTATDFYMADPDIIFGGSQKQRFDKNKKALELLEELNAEGRQATAEEQVVLASYTGWGSFGQDLFQGTWNTPVFKDGWKDENLWLREKLGKESWESAKDSVLNAFFTDPYTVQAMWSMAEKMGFTGGRVLEPAIGTGNFISLMPMHIKQRSQVTAIDLDITTAAIAKQLFPESNVQNMPYQKSKTPDNFYDLVISNVPFSNDVKIADRRYNQFNPNLHDYYFLKMLDQVRPGGIVMAITSSGTMDKQSEVIRREMGKQSELITSIRLPAGAFKDFAGTNVVTDIIVLRKRTEPLTMTPDEKWIKPAIIITPSGKPVTINSFFALNPQNVLGTIDFGSGTTRFGAGMIVQRPHDLKQLLENAANFVPEKNIGFISGPSFATEVKQGLPCALVINSSSKKLFEEFSAFFPNFIKTYYSSDVIGAEVAGAYKNVLAIASGICEGLNLGKNAQASLIARGLVEMERFGKFFGAKKSTFLGLSGAGDLFLTANSTMSRNYRVGLGLASNKNLEDILKEIGEVAEGIKTAEAIHNLSFQHNIYTPIANEVKLILDGKNPKDSLKDLLKH